MHDMILLLFIFPFIASILVFALGGLSARVLKPIALTLAMGPLLLLAVNHSGWVGTTVDYLWISQLSIHFNLSVDGLSLLFLYLTAIVIPISMYGTRCSEITHPNIFFGLILFLEGLLIGFFSAGDLALFTLFWEGMLLPLYFIINLWGGAGRRQAALKFLVYMIAGSSMLVAAVLSLYFASGSGLAATFNIESLARVAQDTPHSGWIFTVLVLAFAVKTPLFPFHAWLPDAYCEAPVSGTILLSAILSKAGIYGIIRIGMGLFPTLMYQWSFWLLGFAIVGVFYGALAAWRQFNYKRLIAYSSFSHVNFILAGLFAFEATALTGGVLQALNHGVTIAGLFLLVGWLEHRLGTTAIGEVGGVAKYMPKLCWLTLFFVLASVALPGTNNFVGELLILFGVFKVKMWVAAVLGLSIIISVVYMLRFMQKMYFGIPSPRQDSWKDIGAINFLIAAPLVVLILWIGIYPSPVLNAIAPVVEKINTAAYLEYKS